MNAEQLAALKIVLELAENHAFEYSGCRNAEIQNWDSNITTIWAFILDQSKASES